ncbi:MAG: cob(I)yrinic acid a,c-diamide adenosyltransferase [Deltaproteobacteria bacterium]|nr:cob(I)yrinic acid a,c-diamide adenosyltransferase [Deltaproteobacteria bacterium]
MATCIYTKTGDNGQTGLGDGRRVNKDHIRVEVCGTIDELNAVLGQLLALRPPEELSPIIKKLQKILLDLGAELSNFVCASSDGVNTTNSNIKMIEQSIDKFAKHLAPLRNLILPGGSIFAATLHVARTICRRCERRIVTLFHNELNINTAAIVLLNRMSDLLFVLARYANTLAGISDETWVKDTSI